LPKLAVSHGGGEADRVRSPRHGVSRTLVRPSNCSRQDDCDGGSADFEMLERAVKTGPEFAKLFGITTIGKPSSNSAKYPYTLTDLAEKVTGKTGAYWAEAQAYIARIKTEKKIDIKKYDNRYHCATKTGKKSVAHKYSDHLLELIQKKL
jgi:hypothetical protein